MHRWQNSPPSSSTFAVLPAAMCGSSIREPTSSACAATPAASRIEQKSAATTAGTAASAIRVMPWESSRRANASSRPRQACGSSASARPETASARNEADSSSTPVGRPRPSRRIRPPGGSAVVRPMPSASRPAELTTLSWYVRDWTWSGRSGTARSSSAAVGERCSARRSGSYPWYRSQEPAPGSTEARADPGAGAAAASRPTRSTSSRTVRALRSSTSVEGSEATRYAWRCGSMNAGSTAPRSSRRSEAPAGMAVRTLESDPAATTRPSSRPRASTGARSNRRWMGTPYRTWAMSRCTPVQGDRPGCDGRARRVETCMPL